MITMNTIKIKFYDIAVAAEGGQIPGFNISSSAFDDEEQKNRVRKEKSAGNSMRCTLDWSVSYFYAYLFTTKGILNGPS